MKQILFIDRDGVVLEEPPIDFQIDTIAKTNFVKGALNSLSRIAADFDFYKVMVTNQDGLGTASYPEEQFYPYHDLMIRTLDSVGFHFDEMIIDKSFAAENLPTRKPGTGLLKHLISNDLFDLPNSFVIGDRWSDIQLAINLGAKAIYFKSGLHELTPEQVLAFKEVIVLETNSWEEIYSFLKLGIRKIHHERNTNETSISIDVNMDGSGKAVIETGLGFFDHMLDQIARHGKIDLTISTKGDLYIDEHHTIEDTGIALGEAFAKALSDKRGMERYGFALPMDEADAKVLIDFGGRNWLVWNAEFKREKIGEMPTEMFYHFFKSFSDGAKCNLNIECKGDNEHHKIEAIFKAFAKAIRMAVKRDPISNYLPSTKGVL
ncbi:MAG: bifunctional imidazole glycerol-phosphate dehydratase/histidinol phosphatase [Sphingobacteriia bacterium 24-36-13]|jgi:imidazoleglycerol-phosphate dehydratase/histidinol-phosphatase|uniref:bifunctional histidinol-phosphatase/imidazoleglycerol-phosphate dehydratase HisB n=1 Tax=Sediminibacterium sp. TaxID=1917865 RepID=UPI000BD6AA33|nr:bifunctional histidinol-phosphatase/imidazoleglycerol-phosphate dehydratase HisB [Sediminibacterium sp.]OYY09445.1 MAG: bifunctional imidazole glycerol-phosphate dehydratase/histidinol phosphatase [Sphingobacteriia bacterium 35-36-14]OYZ53765.1 MAG: bifunctional imidazole glycerol-phosphate dehydratase/histidinol phosphatase [Sphingobacteriia bacterium 24-36-13]OZA65738.1 MAG: bifunctional imidazole glycerol-phosphate dehydratase/histidinol phosphatase [Sphingobacteriia bacterium 39-36-14]HQ